MFGYIRVDKPELKIREFETYKAIYCTLCRKLGRRYGPLSRLTLSYDFAFLSVLNMALKPGQVCFERKRCAFNPMKKCNYCTEDKMFDLPAAAAMILMYEKILDNIADEKGLRKFGFKLLKPICRSAYKKAAGSYPHIAELATEYLTEQHQIEAENCTDLDRASEPSAKMLSKLLCLCSEDLNEQRVLERLGYCLGRYIYLLDAACDLPQDIKSGAYNVFKGETDVKKRVEPQLYFCINEAGKAFELLDPYKYRTILGNIIYLGLEKTFQKELSK
ncbi:MAG: DUF5685 family protein [Clostridia bacterium]|nr:DUF5685 family protein [Clostridia bacterium]